LRRTPDSSKIDPVLLSGFVGRGIRRIQMIHLLTALACEAKPIIEYYHLSRLMSETEFSVYGNESLTLTVAGVGTSSMAAAVAYTHVLFGKSKQSVWLNVGVAGHRSHEIGKVFVVHKINDGSSGKNWYPSMVYRPGCATESLQTVARQEVNYSDTVLYDMEGSGFYESAIRFSCSELVQCIKVVSDNALSPTTKLQPKFVSELIINNLVTIEDLIEQLVAISNTLPKLSPMLIDDFVERWHFSVQQKIQLGAGLNRWKLLSGSRSLNFEQLNNYKTSKQVLNWLECEIDQLPIDIS